MKNPNRTVVVEYKNRRARKGNASLRGNLDLKSLAREVEADATLPFPEAPVTPDPAPPVVSNAEVERAETASLAEPVTAIPAEAPIKTAKPQPDMRTGEIAQEEASVRRPLKKPRRRKQVESLTVAEHDIQIELSSLETENAILRREWAAKLRAENGGLLLMLKRFEQRLK